MKELRRTYTALENQLGRPATEEEVATTLGLQTEDFHKLLMTVGRSALLSLDEMLVGEDGSERRHLGDAIHDTSALPAGVAELQERRRILANAIDRLPERERTIIALYYYEGMTFKEVGRILTISESRVFQLHTQAVIRLNTYLLRDVDLFAE
jgi:RNA polymerase sigma factor for flagellar operon FliA